MFWRYNYLILNTVLSAAALARDARILLRRSRYYTNYTCCVLKVIYESALQWPVKFFKLITNFHRFICTRIRTDGEESQLGWKKISRIAHFVQAIKHDFSVLVTCLSNCCWRTKISNSHQNLSLTMLFAAETAACRQRRKKNCRAMYCHVTKTNLDQRWAMHQYSASWSRIGLRHDIQRYTVSQTRLIIAYSWGVLTYTSSLVGCCRPSINISLYCRSDIANRPHLWRNSIETRPVVAIQP
jgi:hypothetical protein